MVAPEKYLPLVVSPPRDGATLDGSSWQTTHFFDMNTCAPRPTSPAPSMVRENALRFAVPAMFHFSANRLFLLSRTEYPSYAVSVLRQGRAAPFRGEPQEVAKVKERFRGMQPLADGKALVEDYERVGRVAGPMGTNNRCQRVS